MNNSEKDTLFLRIGVNAKSTGTLLAGLAVGGPIGLLVAGCGVAMFWGGNKWLNAEVERMERERASGEDPHLPSIPR